MDLIESFIDDLKKENSKLIEELEQAQKDVKDFEKLAIEWKKGYRELNKKYNEEISNLKQIIEELEIELKNYKKNKSNIL